ncbi:signal recognition particle subunit SRP68 [Sitodiplosis mosellana]|uniref:signal recognition particle subunit SRP68 n=1 Tax=Sitodiplosis mosellana TaxID=263140 RepID=UPI00244531F2|nr:signal recognition particle subunit SRP68 [Sitodiplosis mosellana]
MVEDTNVQETDVKSGNAPVESEQKPLFSIEILRLIRDAQKQHGLRHGDFQRYRGYCTRRISRLRKALKLPQGDKRHYKKRDVTVAHLDGATGKVAIAGPSGDERFLYLPLMLAERAWSYAMQLRQEANTEPRKRFHLVNKLRRACIYSLQLQELCSQSHRLDDKTKLEVEAYVACMHGNLHFELGLWQLAAENFKKSQIIYENLVKVIQATSANEEVCDLYRSKIEELKPNLRYCAYNLGSKSDSAATIDEMMLEIRRAQGASSLINLESFKTAQIEGAKLETIEWRNYKIQIRLPEKVRLFLLSLQDLDKSIEQAKTLQNKIDIVETVLIDCKDSIQAAKDDFLKSDSVRKGAAGDSASNAPTVSNNVQLLLAYLNYIRLIRTLERNLYLVAQTKQSLSLENTVADSSDATKKGARPQNLTRLYEIIAQNVLELQQIAGFENDKAYQNEIQNLSIAFKAFRCYYIAMTLVSLFRWKEAVALYERSKNYATDALQNPPAQFNLKQELTTLLKDIESCKFSAHAYSVLADDGSAASNDGLLYLDGSGRKQKSLKSKPLFDRLSHYVEDQQLNSKNPNVYKLTPDIEPIPCKPLFFDLALNFVELPSLDDKIDSPVKKQQQQQGISGFVKGFLGWGSGSGAK